MYFYFPSINYDADVDFFSMGMPSGTQTTKSSGRSALPISVTSGLICQIYGLVYKTLIQLFGFQIGPQIQIRPAYATLLIESAWWQVGWLHSSLKERESRVITRRRVNKCQVKQEAPDPDVKCGLYPDPRVVTTSPNIDPTRLPLKTLEGWQEDVVRGFTLWDTWKVAAQAYTANPG